MMGRVTIIRSILSAISIFLLSYIIVLSATLSKLEQLFRNFLWGSHQERTGVHLLAWDVLCLPIRKGRLGIQSLHVR